MPSFTPHHRNSISGVPAVISRLARSLDTMARGARWSKSSDGPFAEALHAVDARGEDAAKALADHSMVLGPLTKRHILEGLEGVPKGLRLGWVQLPGLQGAVFSLGAFTDRSHFSQIALADGKGRVFVGSDPLMDTHGMEPRFLFGVEGKVRLPDGPRFGHERPSHGEARYVDAVQGGIVGRDESGRMLWLASWLKADDRYTLEQMRAVLPASMRFDLEYRDALAIAFFAAYMLPQIQGLLIGFGSGNIFRRLNREAPMGAIRRCLRDTADARAHGLRASGLEDHFADLMHEAKALDSTTGLEAVHGAEPLHLYTSTYSGGYFFTWSSGLQFPAALKSLRIEGNLNRFADVSAWLERNARLGLTPTEDTVTHAQAARIDWMLLEDPALIALRPGGTDESGSHDRHARQGDVRPRQGDDRAGGERHAVLRMFSEARSQAARIAEQYGADRQDDSEWLYRQTVSTLLRRLRVPYRFDVEFRSNLRGGQTAFGFTTAGPMMMPSSRYDDASHDWVSLDEGERAAMSARYNLRIGLMMAAMAFGAGDRIRQVSLHIDSIGLEEAVAEQDSAISDSLSRMLRSIERIRSGDVGLGGMKGDPKDGDYHGDPSRTPTRAVDIDGASDIDGAAEQPGESPSEGRSGADDMNGAAEGPDMDHADKATVDSRFEDLMRGIDLDEVAFNVPQGNAGPVADAAVMDSATGFDDLTDVDDGVEDDPSDPSDPLNVLQASPTARTMVTVTFTRDALLKRLREDGLEHPVETYRMFDAVMDLDAQGGLKPVEADFELKDARFAPVDSQEEPEMSERVFDEEASRILGTHDAMGLSIQRADLLKRGVSAFHGLAADETLPSVTKAQRAMRLIDRIADPELTALAPQVTSALIDGRDTPDFEFQLNEELDRERGRARDLLFSGQMEQAIETIEHEIGHLDAMYAANPGVPRYFNSYAERVVYNRLFATVGEKTVLIPDDLFYAHMELADVLSQIKGAKAALPHLNAMVSYAPAYPLSHLKLAVQLARLEDWDSARAACLNALRVALDRDDAAFAYYRFAYAEWMRDQFVVAAAAYIMSEHISPGQIGALEAELHELVARADSQCIVVPDDVEAAKGVLAANDLPIWPQTEVAPIVDDAARVCVDEGMFVPARTLAVARTRMNDDGADGIDVIQAQFLRSLNG